MRDLKRKSLAFRGNSSAEATRALPELGSLD